MLRYRILAVVIAAAARVGATHVVAAQERPATAVFVSVAAGEYHSCGLTRDGAAYCWGLNMHGELGAASTDQCSVGRQKVPCARRPIAVTGELRFTAVAVGSFHTCGLTAQGEAYCWGENAAGQLGSGDTVHTSTTPLPVAGGKHFTMLTGGSRQTCALESGGAAYCWGLNDLGQLGSDSTPDFCPTPTGRVPCRWTPVAVAGGETYKSISAGLEHICALSENEAAYCWGRGYERQPTAIPGGYTFVAISAGGEYRRGCGLTTSGIPYCWGLFIIAPRVAWPVVNPRRGGSWTTSADTTAWRFASVNMGADHFCGVTMSGVAYCWGANDEGQLGVGDLLNEPLSIDPLAVAGNLKFSMVSGGFSHTCGVTTDGLIYCWGENNVGQLGDGSTDSRNKPSAIAWWSGAATP